MRTWLALGLFLVPAVIRASDECRKLRVSMDLSQRQLSEFLTLQSELNDRYHKYVADDFVNQTDGVLDEVSHSAAVKVVFAQKRLKQAIESKQMSLLSSKNEYCAKCGRGSDLLDRAVFCNRCPTSPACTTAKK